MIIWLASYPRSGNSYFRVICGKVFGIKTYSVYPEKAAQLPPAKLREAARTSRPLIVKTHELPADDAAAISIVRDGRDSVVSYAHWTLAQETEQNQIDPASKRYQERLIRIITTDVYFGGWSRNVLAWHARPNTHQIRFEDLISDPIPAVSSALDFANIPYRLSPKHTPVEFEELHKQNPILYRKGITGNWQTDMSPKIHELFWRHHGSAMEALGYAR